MAQISNTRLMTTRTTRSRQLSEASGVFSRSMRFVWVLVILSVLVEKINCIAIALPPTDQVILIVIIAGSITRKKHLVRNSWANVYSNSKKVDSSAKMETASFESFSNKSCFICFRIYFFLQKAGVKTIIFMAGYVIFLRYTYFSTFYIFFFWWFVYVLIDELKFFNHFIIIKIA